MAVALSVLLSALVSLFTSRMVTKHQRIDLTRMRRDKLFERRLAAADDLSPHFARLLYLVNRILCLSQRDYEAERASIEADDQSVFNEMLQLTAKHLHVLPPSTNDLLSRAWGDLWDIVDERIKAFESGGADSQDTELGLNRCWKIREDLLKEAWFVLDVLEDDAARGQGALVKSKIKLNLKASNSYLRYGDRKRMLVGTTELIRLVPTNDNQACSRGHIRN